MWVGPGRKYLLASGDVWNVRALAPHINLDFNGQCWESTIPNCNPVNRFTRCRHWGEPGHESATSAAHKAVLDPSKREDYKARFTRSATPDELAALRSKAPSTAPDPGNRGRGQARGRTRGIGRPGSFTGRHRYSADHDGLGSSTGMSGSGDVPPYFR